MNKVAAFALRRKALVFERERTEHRITLAYAGKSKSLPSLHIGSRDHPRVCGEKPQNQKTPPQLIGSPPRVRGKAHQAGNGTNQDGITPARAGKSCRSRYAHRSRGDHPRMCGEKCGYRLPFRSIVESPPRMRGKGVGAARIGCGVGITPACTGKRCGCSRRLPERRDHPRACGEKRVVAGGHVEVYRITPACAGKRSQGFAVRLSTRDHPRVCGEKLSTTSTDIHPAGSPPRMRGKAVVLKWSCRETRITPACAGKS